jgi:hypothetical protein
MEKNKPGEQHRRLGEFVGTWAGREKIAQPSPYTTKTEAGGTLVFRLDMGGLFLMFDYQEEADGELLLAGHGVIGWDAKGRCYTLHWFDTFGIPPSNPGRGQWHGDTLAFEHDLPSHKGRTIFQLGEGALAFRVEMDNGNGWQPAVEGTYVRSGTGRRNGPMIHPRAPQAR